MKTVLVLAGLVPMACGLAFVACRSGSPSTADAGAPAAPPASVRTTADAGHVAPAARCTVASTGPSLGVGVDGVLVGDVVATPTGFAVGVLRSNGPNTSATVILLPPDMTTATVVDLGASVGDSPPAHPFITGGQVFAALYVRGRADAAPAAGSRTLGFFRIDGGKGTLGPTLEQSVDESAAVDVAGGAKGALVAWDEAGPAGDGGRPTGDAARAAGGSHGLIKVAVLDPARPADTRIAPHVVSPDTSDADEPKVAARDGGYWVAWIAHRQQPNGDASAPAELEGPAESRDSRWIEIVAVDDAGKVVGPARRLTSGSGHVSAFTLVARPATAPGQTTLDVFARDDEEASEGAGGRILRIGVRIDGADPPAVLVAEGAGRGAPEVMTAAASTLLFYADTTDHTRLLPLGESGTPLGPSSLEPALSEARPLAASHGASGPKDKPTLFAVFPGERGTSGLAPVRTLTCGL
jgi:hypothetical protein